MKSPGRLLLVVPSAVLGWGLARWATAVLAGLWRLSCRNVFALRVKGECILTTPGFGAKLSATDADSNLRLVRNGRSSRAGA